MKKHLLITALSLTTTLLNGQIVNIPDANFKASLLSHSPIIDINNNKEVELSEAEALNYLNIYNKSITDLTGIESFANLDSLDCRLNNLTSINISNNKQLTYLECSRNRITSLDVSKNETLVTLYCYYNQITTLDVSKNIKLQFLEINHNKIEAIDISNNVALIDFVCNSNQLNTLNVSNNVKLTSLICSSNRLTALDVSRNTDLTFLYCGINNLSAVDVSNNPSLKYFHCISNHLTDLNVSKNPSLILLICADNNLKALDVTNNTALTTLDCYANLDLFQICINTAQLGQAGTWQKDDNATWNSNCVVTDLKEEVYIRHDNKEVYRVLTSLGQEIKLDQAVSGVFIFQFTDGSTRKIVR